MNLAITAPRWWRAGMVVVLAVAALVAGTLLRYGLFVAASPGLGFADYLRALCVHDCSWYESLARSGYDLMPQAQQAGDRANWAFFPLFPMLVAALGRLLGGDLLLAGFVVSSLATLATALLGFGFLGGSWRAYGLFCLLLFVGPFGLYASTLYTESLFMALTLGGFAALQRGSYIGAGMAGALLSATRVSGVLFSLAMVLTAVIEARQSAEGWWMAVRQALRRSDVVLAIVLAPLGLFAFVALLYVRTGDGLAFIHIQRAWDRTPGNPLEYLWLALLEGTTGAWPSVNQSWALASVAGLALCIELLRRRQAPMALFCALALILPLMTGVLSMTRFVCGLAPLGLCLVSVLAVNRWVAGAAAVALVAGGVLALPLWLAASRYLM